MKAPTNEPGRKRSYFSLTTPHFYLFLESTLINFHCFLHPMAAGSQLLNIKMSSSAMIEERAYIVSPRVYIVAALIGCRQLRPSLSCVRHNALSVMCVSTRYMAQAVVSQNNLGSNFPRPPTFIFSSEQCEAQSHLTLLLPLIF